MFQNFLIVHKKFDKQYPNWSIILKKMPKKIRNYKIQARFGEIIYLDDKEEQWQSQAARKMFDTAHIPTRKYQKTGRKIVVEL